MHAVLFIMYRLHTKGEVAKSLAGQPSPRCVTSLYYDYTKFKNQVDKLVALP